MSGTEVPPAANEDHTLRRECQGTALRCYVDGTLRISTTDATYTGSSVGIMSGNGAASDSAVIDTWMAGDLGQTVSTLSLIHISEPTRPY